MHTVQSRLDDMARRLDSMAPKGPTAYTPPHSRSEPERIAEPISQFNRHLDPFTDASQPASPPAAPSQVAPAHLPPAIDLAVAEIAARRRALIGAQPEPRRAPAPSIEPLAALPPVPPAVAAATPMPIVTVPRATVPAQDLSSLEDQLRAITTQIETLRTPAVEEAINALRTELGDMARTLPAAMPRHAIEAIERQIAELTQRIAEDRRAGAGDNALAGIEHGLTEVRDALQHLTPVENLIGFGDAIHNLAHKIDMIVADKDPATIQKLESAIGTLREMSQHFASNDAVNRLAEQVQKLAQNVEHIGRVSTGDALAPLEQRIAVLSEALAERAQSGVNVPPRLEALVNSLSDKIEQVQLSRGDNIAASHLEDRITALVQKLDASDTRLSHLEAIERGLADLLVHIEDIKVSRATDDRYDNASPFVVDELRNDIARTQSTLDAVHDTLGHVVDRLAVIEQGLRAEANVPHYAEPVHEEPLELTEHQAQTSEHVPLAPEIPPCPAVDAETAFAEASPPIIAEPMTVFTEAPSAVTESSVHEPHELSADIALPPQPPPAAPPARPAPIATEATPLRRLPVTHQLIDPDQPLEPGSGQPASNADPAARIAASEAALGGVRPAITSVPSNRSAFIAAARRAAQAANKDTTPRRPRSAAEFMNPEGGEPDPSMRERLMKRVKSLFIAASIIAIVVGGVQIAGNVVNFGPLQDKLASGDSDEYATVPLVKTEEPANVATDAAPAPALATAPSAPVTPATPPATMPPGDLAVIAPGITPMPNAAGGLPSILSAPGVQMPGPITGSITAPASPAPAAAPSLAPDDAHGNADRLPAAIGGIRLRSAATAGDAAAAYEVGVRYADGKGVPADATEAARWIERAAAKGLAPAQFRYGNMLEKGRGVKKDLGEARRLYLAAAAAGNAKAMHNLAVLYAEGVDNKPDYGVAAQWFHKAAERGIPDSQFNLGMLYARGLGVGVDFTESYKWFALAAEKGDKEAIKKRDEVATKLDAHALAAAQAAIKAFAPVPQPDAAVNVPVPSGGWDNAANGQPVPRVKPRVGAPLVIGKR
jgi:localization factor PodJL